eukprot:3431708-Heterocapsa_arctica.AAC.1
MGDSRAPVDFRKAYKPGLDKWQSELEETWGTEDTKASVDLGNDLKWTSNLGTTVFADDLARTQVIKTPAAAKKYIKEADTSLGVKLKEQGHSQNASQKVVMPHFKKRAD